MTFSRQRATKYKANIDTVTAAELNGIDTNQSLAVDGTEGGTWAPSGQIQIDGSGFGSDNILASTVTEDVTKSATGIVQQSFNDSMIADVATTQLVDMSADIYWIYIPASNIQVRLAVSSGQTPANGDMITIVRFGLGNGTFKIESEDNPGFNICGFPLTAVNQADDGMQATFIFDSIAGTWYRLRLCCDATMT